VTDLLDRVPPQDLVAEQAVLGACLTEHDAIGRAEEWLRPEDFYSPQHQVLYRAIVDLHGLGRPVDIITIQSALQDAGKLETCGGRSYLSVLMSGSQTAAVVPHYAEIVQQKARLRELAQLGSAIHGRAMGGGPWDGDGDPDTICSDAAEQLLAISRRKPGDFMLFREAASAAYGELETASERPDGLLGIDTGIASLNALLPGWPRGDYSLLAARPSVGKSALALQQACHAAENGERVAYFSLEMGASSLIHRYLARVLPAELNLVRRARFGQDWAPVANAIAATWEWQFWLCCRSDLTVSQLRGDVRSLASRLGGLDLVVVDYLGLVRPDAIGQNRVGEVRQISAGLKAIAQESGAAVLALSQLSRQVEMDGTWPQLRHLRDSGDLEQDADNVVFLHAPRERDFPKHFSPAEVARALLNSRGLFVAKQRNGPTGKIWVHWTAAHQEFAAVDMYHAAEVEE
jgi:replicative DNA helicase